ncbi:MAG: aldose 1-epimerase family protein [Candidatus Latescibacterota bacterium]
MAQSRTWVLTDAPQRVWEESFGVGAGEVGIGQGWSIRKRTLRAGLSQGVDLIEVDNGALSFCVLPTRGMGIWRGAYRGLTIGWDSPVRGPVHPQFVALQDRGGLGWLTGFDEAIVRCGLDSTGAPGPDVVPNNMGVPTQAQLTLHGRIANLPASRVEVHVTPGDPPELRIVGEVYEAGLFYPAYRLRATVATRCGSNVLTLRDEVTNLRGVPAEMEVLYHCNFGPPFLEEGSRLVTAARQVVPRDARAVEGIEEHDTYLGPTPGYVEQVYWYDLLADPAGNTLAMLRNRAADRGLVLRFTRRQLPAFTQWKNTQARGDGYVTGLEPGTDYPNAKAFERRQGRLVGLAAGGTWCAELALEVLDSAPGVASVEAQIARLQRQAPRQVHRQPNPVYSPLE